MGEESRAAMNTMNSDLQGKTLGEVERQLAVQESISAFKTVVHNDNFKPMVCTTAIAKTLFNTRLICSQTKTKVIIKNTAMKKVPNDLKEAHLISVTIHSSNHLNLKLFLFLTRYYHNGKYVRVKALELVSLGGETSDILSSYVPEVSLQTAHI